MKYGKSRTWLQLATVADWDSMDRVITLPHSRAFSFLLNPQKLGQAFQKLS